MIAFQRVLLFAVFGVFAAAIAGCSEPEPNPTPDSDTPPPPAQTADQISEQERLAAEAEKAEREIERRIQRNQSAINDLMFLGMTVAEANEALGVNGVKGASIAGSDKEHESYEWKLEGGITIKAKFVNGKLDQKEMVE